MDQAAVRGRYIALLGRLQLSADIYPFRTEAGDDGSAHIVFNPEGSADVLVTERGMTLRQDRFIDPDDLLYRLLSDVAFDVACRRQRADRPSGHDPARRIFMMQRSLLARLDPAWAARLEAAHADQLAPEIGAQSRSIAPAGTPLTVPVGSRLALPGLLLTVCGLLVALHVWGLHGWVIDRNLARSGLTAQATIVGLEPHRTSREMDIWRVRFRLALEGARTKAIERLQAVDRRTYDRLGIGDRVTVRYPPGRPDQARLADNDQITNRLFILLLIDLVLGFAAVRVWRALVKAGREATA